MKKITTVMLTILSILALMITISCSKPKDGAQGPPGNANVINYSITVHPNDWSYSPTDKQWFYDYNCSINLQAAVIGYVMSGNGKQILTYSDVAANVRYTMANDLFWTTPYIQFQYVNYNSYSTGPTSDTYFYLVAMPPAMKTANPNVDWSNYEEVKNNFKFNQ